MIRFDQSSTFVEIPPDIVFDDIIDGEIPANVNDRLQDECAAWFEDNVLGDYGITTSKWRHYTIWFEHLNEAILFKLRWFNPPPEQIR